MISKKLRDTSGASVLLALLFFLLCAMAGSVILASGTAAAGRMKDVKDREQSYYTVTSAAKLLREEIKDKSIHYDMDNRRFLKEPDGAISDLLTEAVEQLAGETGESVFGPKQLTIDAGNLTSGEDAKPLREVTAEFSMVKGVEGYSDYTILMDFYLKGEKKKGTYMCKLKLPGAVQDYADESDSSSLLTLVWTNAFIDTGADTDGTN